MKKLFTLLAMVGLAFASCTPETPQGPNTGNEQEVLGAAEFVMSVSNIGETSALLKVAPKQDGRTYYWNIATEASLNEFATTKAYMEDYHAYLAQVVDAGQAAWAEILDNAAIEYETKKLNPNTKYILWAFGIDLNGNLTSADLSYVKFETPKSTFDPSLWYGYWQFSSEKHVSIGEDPFSGYLVSEFVDQPLDKVIAIADASADFGEGYVYVYGWDGVFDLEMPALGLVSSNNIKLVNETVLFTEDDATYGPLDYTWQGTSYLESYGDWYTIGGSYACYTLTMDAATKAVTGVAYQGQITDGTPFMTDYYSLGAVITTGEYEGRSLGFSRADGQAALYLSGANLTAEFLAPLDEVSAKKLNANKKFKVAHKMATPKAAVKMFSSIAK